MSSFPLFLFPQGMFLRGGMFCYNSVHFDDSKLLLHFIVSPLGCAVVLLTSSKILKTDWLY